MHHCLNNILNSFLISASILHGLEIIEKVDVNTLQFFFECALLKVHPFKIKIDILIDIPNSNISAQL